MSMRFGWKRRNPDHPLLYLKHYINDPRAVTVPNPINWTALGGTYGMDGNDQYGDCVEAAMYHADQVMANGAYEATAQQALGLYSTLTGFNPNNPNSDQGTDIPTALDWWMNNPLPGTSSQLGVYLSLDVNDPTEIALALWLGGEVLIGFDVPYSAEQQYDSGQVWTVVNRSPIVGGHCINITMNDSAQGLIGGVTWGKFQEMSLPFWNKYVSEAYVLFNQEWVGAAGIAPNQIAWDALNADILAQWGKNGPFVGTVPPTPPVPPVTGQINAVSAMQSIQSLVGEWNGE